MIIILIGVVLLIIAIAGYLILEKLSLSYFVYDILLFISYISGTLGSCTVFVCLLLILFTHIGVDCDIYSSQLTHDSIVKQIECVDTEYEDISKIEVIKKVYEWNQNVYKEKYYSENPWTNWLVSKRHADSLEYIELEDY